MITPQKEQERIVLVDHFLNLNFSKEKELQEIVMMAAEICHTKTALITLLNGDTQFVKFKVGSTMERCPREATVCNYTIGQDDVLVVPDALLDKRFVNHALVTNYPYIRFYAGSPLTTPDGHNLGSLCVIDSAPKQLSLSQKQMLKALSKQVINLLHFDYTLAILKEKLNQARESEIKLQSFFESTASLHVLLGKNMEILAFNKALARFVKKVYQVKITTGMIIKDFLNEGYIPDFIGNYQKALLGQSLQDEKELVFGKGHLWCHVTYDPARNPEGEVIGVTVHIVDVTVRVEQEQKALMQNEALKKIAYIQSHEMRKPVASIIGLMDVFENDGYDSTREEMLMMKKAVMELEEKIRLITSYTE